jgi:flagellar motility protein MotE (MotC chaperone)
MIGRLRLIDAVAVAAVTLLGIKGLDFALKSPAPSTAAPGVSAVSGGELPGFARVLAHARTNYVPPEVIATGATPDKAEPRADSKPDPRAQGPAPSPRPVDAVPASVSPAERALLERLGERRDELQMRARDLDMRERLLDNAEKKIEGRINELKTLEDRGGGEAGAARKPEADGAMKNLVLMYETMKPKDAARVFDRLSHDVLVPVVLQMNPRKMAEVLAVMSPEAAEKLTVALANRSRAPQPDRAPGAAPQALNELPAIDAPVPRRGP